MGNPLTGEISYYLDNTSESNTVELEDGYVYFNLYSDSYIIFLDLPYGTNYEVTEEDDQGYYSNIDSNIGTINSLNENAVVLNTFKIGDEITYYITVLNSGMASAEDVIVSDYVPNG